MPDQTQDQTNLDLIPEPQGDLTIVSSPQVEPSSQNQSSPVTTGDQTQDQTPVLEETPDQLPQVSQEAPPPPAPEVQSQPQTPIEPIEQEKIITPEVVTPVLVQASEINERGSSSPIKVILIGVILVLLGVLLGVLASNYIPLSTKTTTPTPTSSPTPDVSIAPEPDEKSVQTFENSKYGFSIEMPTDWKPSGQSGTFDYLFPFVATDSSSLEILVRELPAKSDLEKYLSDQDKISKTAYEGKPSKSIISTNKITVGDMEGVEREEEFLAAGFIGRVVYLASDKYVYSLSFIPGGSNKILFDTEVYKAKKDTQNSFRLTNQKRSQYTCPKSEWVNCMPSPGSETPQECEPDFLTWAKENCPGFKGAAL